MPVEPKMPPMINPPILVFEGNVRRIREMVAWTGPWPPPETLIVIDGSHSGGVAHFDPGNMTARQRSALSRLRSAGYVEYIYRRTAFSKLPAVIDYTPNTHLFRGATYVLAMRMT